MKEELEQIQELICAIDSSLQVALHLKGGDREYKDKRVGEAMKMSCQVYDLVDKLITRSQQLDVHVIPDDTPPLRVALEAVEKQINTKRK